MGINEDIERGRARRQAWHASTATEQQAKNAQERRRQAEIEDLVRKFVIWMRRSHIAPTVVFSQRLEKRWRRKPHMVPTKFGWELPLPDHRLPDPELRYTPSRPSVKISVDGEFYPTTVSPEDFLAGVREYGIEHNTARWPE